MINKRLMKDNKRDIEDKLLIFLDKNKFKLELFQVIMNNFNNIKQIILRNGNIIDFEEITGQLMYITKNIEKYDSLIVSYRVQAKSIELFKIEKDELLNTQSNLLKNLFIKIEENLLKAKELIIFNTVENNTNDIHILISDKNLHSISGPAIYSDNYSIIYFYINGEVYIEDEWQKHILVRGNKIRKIINKNINKKQNPIFKNT